MADDTVCDAAVRTAALSDVETQAEGLCETESHITGVIGKLNINSDWFSDYDDPERAKYSLIGVVKAFIYKEARGFNQSELERRLRGAAYVYVRFGLDRPLIQQTISQNWKYRLTATERRFIETAAEQVRDICIANDLTCEHEPALDPDDVVPEEGIGEEQIRKAVKLATELGFDEFSAGRASNFRYPLVRFFERQGLMNLNNFSTTSEQRMFEREYLGRETPHGSTHNRTMKKAATPDPATTLADYEGGRKPLSWKRIRDTILPAFHAGVEKQLDEIAGRDRQGLRQPVHAALDITPFPFYVSPFRNEDEVDRDDEPVVGKNGREVYPKADYPEMVSGFKGTNKEKAQRGYKFATLTIVGQDTPIILAIEPVRDERWWEKADDDVDVERTPRVDIVTRLLDQAEQHVEIHKLFCDREFDIHAVRDVIAHRHEDRPAETVPPEEMRIQYVIGKKETSNEDGVNIKEIIEDPIYNTRIEHAEGWQDGRMHKLSIIYLPGHDEDDSEGYSMFTVNGWVDADRAQALVGQYRQRWTIENQYKSIKEDFLPQTASKDYRIRFLYFVIGVILHNVWRLANFVLRDMVTVNLGDSPPMPAKEIVQLISKFLFDPGDPFTL
jgi:hypothetical protein